MYGELHLSSVDTMMRESRTNPFTKQVHFANGFPAKGLLQAASPSHYRTRGHFVSLDDESPRAGKNRHSIPPLAKGRGQFCSTRDRPENERYRKKPDPLNLPKAAEKTGFSASQIKHAKQRTVRACRSTEPPSVATVYNLKNLARREVYSTPPNRPLDIDLEDEMMPPSHHSVENKAKNIKIISDVEKKRIQAELAGIGEVYQRICQGKTESLHSLLFPSRRDTKRGTVQYISTTAPVQLRTPKIVQHVRKTAAEDKDIASVGPSESEKNKQGKNCIVESDLTVGDTKHEDNKRPVLIPLPFIRSQINVVSSVKQQKPTYSVPYIYSNGPSNKGKLQDPHKQNTTSAAVIMFDPMNIPDLGHGGALKSNFAVEWKSANKSNKQDNLNTDFKISHSRSTPVILPSAPVQGTVTGEKSSKLDIESVSSDTDFQREQTVDLDAGKGDSTEFVDGDIMVKGIQCSVITDAGVIENVEIYDYSERDVESEQEAAKQIQELEELGGKKIQEVVELLEEHQHILDEVKELEKELNKASS